MDEAHDIDPADAAGARRLAGPHTAPGAAAASAPLAPARARALDHRRAPYLEALERHAATRPCRLTVPSHKGGSAGPPAFRRALGPAVMALDIPMLTEDVDVASPGAGPSPLEHACALAADCYGAGRTWFCVNGASQANQAACLALAVSGVRAAVVQRNVHCSTVDGLVLAGLRPAFVAPEVVPELGIALCVTPAALDAALRAAPGAGAAIVVSPTYHGAIADVHGLAEVAHAHGAVLVVDEAWGAHLAFSPRFPRHALASGADLVTSSTHKHLGSLTGSAMLHLGPGGRIDPDAVERGMALVASTSPNSLMYASLDAARRHGAVHGRALAGAAIAGIGAARARLRATPRLRVLADELAGCPGVIAVDPLRVAVDVRSTGLSGYEAARRLRSEHNVHVELCDEAIVLAAFGLGEDTAASGRRFAEALAAVAGDGPGAPSPVRPAIPTLPLEAVAALGLREAALAAQDSVALDRCAGRVAARTLAVYPPGVPAAVPGERISAAIVAALSQTLRAGGRVRGLASDGTVRVIREPLAGDD